MRSLCAQSCGVSSSRFARPSGRRLSLPALSAILLFAITTQAAAQSFPGVPQNVQASNGTSPTSVAITWQAPSGGGSVTGYKIYRSTTNAFCPGSPIASVGGSTLSHIDNGANANTVYYYSVRATGPGGDGNCSATDAGWRGFVDPPNPPTNVSATDDLQDRVVVTWQPPSSGQPVETYEIYRTESSSQAFCGGQKIATVSHPTASFEDTTGNVEQVYFYAVRALGPSGTSSCVSFNDGKRLLPPPPLPPTGVSASDGTFIDKVRVTWTPPQGSTPFTNYRLHRSTSAILCGSLYASNISSSATGFDDTNVTPGTTYYYSIETIAPDGRMSICSSIDPGFARLAQCNDGIDNDGDGVTDFKPGAGGDPGCSSTNDDSEKDSTLVCDDGVDNDGDGRIDYVANGSGDPGCDSPSDPSEDDTDAALRSPVFAKFNTYLGQWNYAELVNRSARPKDVLVTLYNLRGEIMVQLTWSIPANGEFDIPVNAMLQYACEFLHTGCDGFEDRSATVGAPNGLGRPDGYVDTYGLVRIDFDDSNANERLYGRMSFYRQNTEGTYSFAFAREFKNPTTGASFAMGNTYDPKGAGDLVPNWVEIINFGTRRPDGTLSFETKTFTVNVYNHDGTLREKRTTVGINGLGEFDVHGGHEYEDATGRPIEAVYLIEVIPDDPKTEYFLSVARYSSNAPEGVDPETYNYALVLDGRSGTHEQLFAAIGNLLTGVNGIAAQPFVDNWVETGCVDTKPCKVTALYRSADGTVLAGDFEEIAPKAQHHFNAGAVLPKGTTGSIELVSDGLIMAQSMSYLTAPGTGNMTAFVSTARTKRPDTQVGNINTFLGMQDVMAIFSTAAGTVEASYELTSFLGGFWTGTISLGSGQSQAFLFSNNPAFNFPPNTYGAFTLRTATNGAVMAEVRRVRVDSKGEVDFVMPTQVK